MSQNGSYTKYLYIALFINKVLFQNNKIKCIIAWWQSNTTLIIIIKGWKNKQQPKNLLKKTSCDKTVSVSIYICSVRRLSADHWKPGAVSSARSFKAGCLFKWDRSLSIWVMVVFWSTAASDLRDAQTSSHLIIHTTTGRRQGFPRQRRKLSGGAERIFCQHRLSHLTQDYTDVSSV